MAYFNGCVYGNGPPVTEVQHDECFQREHGHEFDVWGFQPEPWRWAPVWSDEETDRQYGPTPCGSCGQPVHS